MLLNPPSASVARALLMLARSKKTGELRLVGAGKSAAIAVVEGVVRAIHSDEAGEVPRLVELLGEEGALRRQALAEADGFKEHEGKLVGKWLVERGYASAAAVSYGLRRQLAYRMAALFRWGALELSFIETLDEFSAPLIFEPPSTEELIMGALRVVSEDVPIHLLRRRIGDGMLKLTGFGEMLMEGAPLYPEEAALLPKLRQGAPAGDVLAQAKGRVRAIRTLGGLLLIAAVEPPSPGASVYSKLVRKRAQLRRCETPERLLEVGADARSPRSSLRAILREIHPDRLASAAPAPLQRASVEIVAALLEAEAELERRGGGPV